jgi:hypothetical protein
MSTLSEMLQRKNFDDRCERIGHRHKDVVCAILETLDVRGSAYRNPFWPTIGKRDGYFVRLALKDLPRREFR